MLLKGTKISFLGLQVLLTGLWNSKDIQNSRQNRSKNKLFRENECMEVARSELWAPVQSKNYHSPQPILDLAPVVQKVDNAIQRINLYPVDSAIGLPNTYLLDSDISGGQGYPTFEQLGPGL